MKDNTRSDIQNIDSFSIPKFLMYLSSIKYHEKSNMDGKEGKDEGTDFMNLAVSPQKKATVR